MGYGVSSLRLFTSWEKESLELCLDGAALQISVADEDGSNDSAWDLLRELNLPKIALQFLHGHGFQTFLQTQGLDVLRWRMSCGVVARTPSLSNWSQHKIAHDSDWGLARNLYIVALSRCYRNPVAPGVTEVCTAGHGGSTVCSDSQYLPVQTSDVLMIDSCLRFFVNFDKIHNYILGQPVVKQI
ncbi:uncharacterized protein [Physcomitrium patens]|nr:uncharacterized protein LOC112294893 [Physcomitrium patens]|eukprot:XP_024401644.1 uncharacterized protein LOC112294893 [Physcomitrella patens]